MRRAARPCRLQPDTLGSVVESLPFFSKRKVTGAAGNKTHISPAFEHLGPSRPVGAGLQNTSQPAPAQPLRPCLSFRYTQHSRSTDVAASLGKMDMLEGLIGSIRGNALTTLCSASTTSYRCRT
jgi:hypothetical protein